MKLNNQLVQLVNNYLNFQLKRFKVRQEYIEERVGTEGVAVICWPDGTKDFYELKDTSIRHVGKTDAGKYESDVSPNPWVQYEVKQFFYYFQLRTVG